MAGEVLEMSVDWLPHQHHAAKLMWLPVSLLDPRDLGCKAPCPTKEDFVAVRVADPEASASSKHSSLCPGSAAWMSTESIHSTQNAPASSGVPGLPQGHGSGLESPQWTGACISTGPSPSLPLCTQQTSPSWPQSPVTRLQAGPGFSFPGLA